jgi:preprotein translocase subunit SecF
MRYNNHFLVLIIALIITSCGSVYKKHYDNGYTFIKHKKKAQMQNSQIAKDLQQKSIGELNANLKLEKEKEQKKAEKSYQTYHKSLEKIENNAPGRVLTSINKFTLKKIEALKPDTVYRKEPAKSGAMSEDVKNKAQVALILAIVSIVIVWFVAFLSLIPAIIALVMAKEGSSHGQTEWARSTS